MNKISTSIFKDGNLVFVLILLLSASVFSCREQSSSKVETFFGSKISHTDLDDFLDIQMNSLNIPALSLAIINNGEVVYHRVKGYADKEKKILANNNSIFEGASISKSVFGFFVMTFVEDGLLDLDTPLYLYLPNPDIEYDERYKKITARMVLSHRSGFPNWRDDYPDKKLFIQFEPDTDYHYSGEGYQYLAEVLKQLLGTNWAGLEAEFQQRVAIPFNMMHTTFIKDDYTRKHKVQPYDEDGNWIDKNASEWWSSRDSVFVAPTTIHSEAIDFSKWMIAMMNKQGLNEKGFDELYKPHSQINSGPLSDAYTLGFVKISLLNIRELYAHNGNNTGFTSNFMFDLDRKWGLVLFTNCKAGDEFSLNLLSSLLLIGAKEKQISIGLTFLFSMALLILNLVLIFFKKAPTLKIRKSNLYIGLIALLGLITSLILMLSTSHTASFFTPLVSVIIILLSFKNTRRIFQLWNARSDKRFELFFQAILLLSIIISGVATGVY